MTIKQHIIDEIEILLNFNLDSTLTGIKIHANVRSGLQEAAKRLHEKGLISQPDGGYLTDLGQEAAEHTQSAIKLITSKS